MDKQPQFWVPIPQKPIANLAISGNRLAPSHKYFDRILSCHESKVGWGAADYLRTLESVPLHQDVLASLLRDRPLHGQLWHVAARIARLLGRHGRTPLDRLDCRFVHHGCLREPLCCGSGGRQGRSKACDAFGTAVTALRVFAYIGVAKLDSMAMAVTGFFVVRFLHGLSTGFRPTGTSARSHRFHPTSTTW